MKFMGKVRGQSSWAKFIKYRSQTIPPLLSLSLPLVVVPGGVDEGDKNVTCLYVLHVLKRERDRDTERERERERGR
jgi:hypothetical protein